MARVLHMLAIVAMLGLTACGAMSTTPPGVFNGLGDDAMAKIVIYRTDDKPFTRDQYNAIAAKAKKMGVVIDSQLSSAFESGAASGGAYGVAGAVGGATQGLFYSGALVGAAAGYTGTVYGLGGVISGLVTASYAQVYAVAAATEMALRDAERYDGKKIFHRVHVVAAFIRSRNNEGDPAPKLAKQMNWHGPVSSGDPAQR